MGWPIHSRSIAQTAGGWLDSTTLNGAQGSPGIKRRSAATDHWHRMENDPGRPYVFRDAVVLLDDFFDEVERVLRERGIKTTVVTVEERGKRK